MMDALAQQALAHNIPVVIDSGSGGWKPMDLTIYSVDYAICFAVFYPPGCNN